MHVVREAAKFAIQQFAKNVNLGSRIRPSAVRSATLSDLYGVQQSRLSSEVLRWAKVDLH